MAAQHALAWTEAQLAAMVEVFALEGSAGLGRDAFDDLLPEAGYALL